MTLRRKLLLFIGFCYCIASLVATIAVVRHTTNSLLMATTSTVHTNSTQESEDTTSFWSEEMEELVFDWLVGMPSHWAEHWWSSQEAALEDLRLVDLAVKPSSSSPSSGTEEGAASCVGHTSQDNIAGLDFSALICQEPIDAVYTWVNGSEPYQLDLLQTWQQRIQLENETLRGLLIGELLWQRWWRKKMAEEGKRALASPTPIPTTTIPDLINIDRKWVRSRWRAQEDKHFRHNPHSSTPITSPFSSQLSSSSSSFLTIDDLIAATDSDQLENQAGVSRFADHDELRYSMRSLATYGGWVRHVYLVTNGQVPTWLNLSHPKITVVSHEQLFPNTSRDLPTFSSNAIESHLHRIPNLSKKFLYFNDDTFFAAPVALEDFYTPTIGHRIYESWQVPSCHQNCPPQWLGDGQCDSGCDKEECAFDLGDCPLPVAEEVGTTKPHTDISLKEFNALDSNQSISRSQTHQSSKTASVSLPFVENKYANTPLGAELYCTIKLLTKSNATHLLDSVNSCAFTQIGNGICDPACDSAQCGFDGLDCAENAKPDTTLRSFCSDSEITALPHCKHLQSNGIEPTQFKVTAAQQEGILGEELTYSKEEMFVSFRIPLVVVGGTSEEVQTDLSLTSATMPLEGLISLLSNNKDAQSNNKVPELCSLGMAFYPPHQTLDARNMCANLATHPVVKEWLSHAADGTSVGKNNIENNHTLNTHAAFMREYQQQKKTWAAFLQSEGCNDDETALLRKLIAEEKGERSLAESLLKGAPSDIPTTTATPSQNHEEASITELVLPTVFSLAFNFSHQFPLGHFVYNKTIATSKLADDTSTIKDETTSPKGDMVSLPYSFITSVRYATSSPYIDEEKVSHMEWDDSDNEPSRLPLANFTSVPLVASATFLENDHSLLVVLSQVRLHQIRTAMVEAWVNDAIQSCGNSNIDMRMRNKQHSTFDFGVNDLFSTIDKDSYTITGFLNIAHRLDTNCLKDTYDAWNNFPKPLVSIRVSARGRIWNNDSTGRYIKHTANYTLIVRLDILIIKELLELVGIKIEGSVFALNSTDEKLKTHRRLLQEKSMNSNQFSIFTEVPVTKSKKPILAPQTTEDTKLDSNESLEAPPSTRRRMADLFGDSLKHTNMLLTKHFGAQVRKVPAHMVHLIDSEAVTEMWNLWAAELNATSSSRFRSKHNIQFALAHFYYLTHATMSRSFAMFVREEIKIVKDKPSPTSWFTYTEAEMIKNHPQSILNVTNIADSDTKGPLQTIPMIETAEEYRRLGLLLWDEDLVNPEPNKPTYGRAALHVVNIDPPYLDRRQARERNEALAQRLVEDTEMEWSAWVLSKRSAGANGSISVSKRFLSAQEMVTIGPWSIANHQTTNASSSFRPPVFLSLEDAVGHFTNLSITSQVLAPADDNLPVLPVAKHSFGKSPLTSINHNVCAGKEHAFSPFVESIYNLAAVNKALIFTALKKVLNAHKKIQTVSRKMMRRETTDHEFLEVFLTSLWNAEEKAYFLPARSPATSSKDNIFARYINETLERQLGYLTLYKGIQRDGLLNVKTYKPHRSLQRNRELDDALPMSDYFYGRVLWLSHVASFRGKISADAINNPNKAEGATYRVCPPTGITSEFLEQRLAAIALEMQKTLSMLGNIKSSRFASLMSVSHQVTKSLQSIYTPDGGSEATGVFESLSTNINLLFYLQYILLNPLTEVTITDDNELASYLYTDKVSLPATLSYVLGSLPIEELVANRTITESCRSMVYEGHKQALKHLLLIANNRVKAFDEDAQAAKEKAALAEKMAAKNGMTTTEKPKSLQEIAAGNLAKAGNANTNWRSRRFGGGYGMPTTAPPTHAPTEAPMNGIDTIDGNFDTFFMSANAQAEEVRLAKVLQGHFSLNTSRSEGKDGVTFIALTSMMKTTTNFSSTLSRSQWPLPPPLSSSQLENSLFGAVMIGVAEENLNPEALPVNHINYPDPAFPKQPNAPSTANLNKRKRPPPLIWQHYMRRTTSPFLSNLQKFSYETVSVDTPSSGVTFTMVRNNLTVVQDQADHIRSKRPKFLCVNDDMDHSEEGREEHLKVLNVLHELFEGYFPTPSPFERTDGQTNSYTRLETHELKRIQEEKYLLLKAHTAYKSSSVQAHTLKRVSNKPIQNRQKPLSASLLIGSFIFVIVSSIIAAIVVAGLVSSVVPKKSETRKDK